MPEPTLLRVGSRGEAVRDVQQRLVAVGLSVDPDDPGEFGPGTERAVRAFQARRGLPVDGLVGRDTWGSLVESGFTLGDRLLYVRRPMARGDDVADLQRRLNALGFDARRVDGIFGPDTARALVEFQRSVGLAGDGICGPSTVAALTRVGGFADGSVAAARERDALRHGLRRLDDRRIFVTTPPGLGVVGEAVARGLTLARAVTVLDAGGGDDAVVARAANAFDAELFVGLRLGTEQAPCCAYFETEGFRSETGHMVAEVLQRHLAEVLGRPVTIAGRAYPLLRETRMAAVVCDLAPDGDVDALAAIVRSSGDVGRSVVRAIRAAYEAPTEPRDRN